MAVNLEDFLIVDCEIAGLSNIGVEYRLRTEIKEVKKNPFYFQFGSEKPQYYQLLIWAENRVIDPEVGELTGWEKARSYFGEECHPLPFYWSTYGKPDIIGASGIIYRECFAALMATYDPKRDGNFFPFPDSKMIELADVYIYHKLRHKNYEQTTDFIRDYDHWHYCLYNTLKWYHYLLGDLSGKYYYSRWTFPVGEKLYKFISPEDFPFWEVELFRNRLK